MNKDYDVSVFIIDEDCNYIQPDEYKEWNYISGMFVCLTNDELNSDCGSFNNSICIYKDTKRKVENTIDYLTDNFDCEYDDYDCCEWQIKEDKIQNDERYCINSDNLGYTYLYTDDWFKSFSILRRYLDGYLSCQNIMSNITKIKGEYKKEQYIPAIMTAYHTKVEYNGTTYRGYLPSIGQWMYIQNNVYLINEILSLITETNFQFIIKNDSSSSFGPWWSSTESSCSTVWCFHNGAPYDFKKVDNRYQILPLFAL